MQEKEILITEETKTQPKKGKKKQVSNLQRLKEMSDFISQFEYTQGMPSKGRGRGRRVRGRWTNSGNRRRVWNPYQGLEYQTPFLPQPTTKRGRNRRNKMSYVVPPLSYSPNTISLEGYNDINKMKKGWSKLRYIVNSSTADQWSLNRAYNHQRQPAFGYAIPLHPAFWNLSNSKLLCSQFETLSIRNMKVDIVPMCGTTCQGCLAYSVLRPDEFAVDNNTMMQQVADAPFGYFSLNAHAEVVTTWNPLSIDVQPYDNKQGKIKTNPFNKDTLPNTFVIMYSLTETSSTTINNITWLVIDCDVKFVDLNAQNNNGWNGTTVTSDDLWVDNSGYWADTQYYPTCYNVPRVGICTGIYGTTRGDNTGIDLCDWLKATAFQADGQPDAMGNISFGIDDIVINPKSVTYGNNYDFSGIQHV